MRAEKLGTKVRQDQIAGAALQLIGAHGVRGFSLAMLARRVGLVPSAIYRHFGSKEEVLDAALDHLGSRLHHNLELVTEDASDPLERLHALLVRHVRLIRENQAIPRIIFSEEVFSGNTERKAKVRGIIRRYLEGVAETVREGQEQARIRADVDPRVVAVHFLGLIQPAAILWHLSDGRFDVTRQTERAWQLFRDGIEARGAAAPRARPRARRGGT